MQGIFDSLLKITHFCEHIVNYLKFIYSNYILYMTISKYEFLRHFNLFIVTDDL